MFSNLNLGAYSCGLVMGVVTTRQEQSDFGKPLIRVNVYRHSLEYVHRIRTTRTVISRLSLATPLAPGAVEIHQPIHLQSRRS